MISRFLKPNLLELISDFPAVGIIGPRQVGKTTIAREIAGMMKERAVYIDLENPRDEVKLTDPVLFFENNINKCVILDEIQRRKDLFPVLRAMIDENRKPSRFILLGSASPELIRDSSESLAGRIIYKELTPFHISELADEEAERTLLVRGGFPNSYMAKSDRISWQWRESFIQTYVERDLPQLGLPLNPAESRRLLRMIAHLHGQLLNYSALANSLGVSSPTVKRYIQFLENAFLVYLLEPYAANSGKRLVKSPKIYIRDAGILNYLTGNQTYEDLFSYPGLGSIWEGYVVEQIRSILPSGIDFSFFRTNHGAEIDLIISLPNRQKIGVEIKFSASPTTSRGNIEAMNALQLDALYIIAPIRESFPLKHKVQVMGLRDFSKYLLSEVERFW